MHLASATAFFDPLTFTPRDEFVLNCPVSARACYRRKGCQDPNKTGHQMKAKSRLERMVFFSERFVALDMSPALVLDVRC